MQIAIFTRYYFIRITLKFSLRFFSGLQIFALNLATFFANQFNPLNIMVIQHRVFHAPHSYAVSAVNFFNHRDVLFSRSVRKTCLH